MQTDPETTTAGDDLLTAPEAAEGLGVHRDTTRRAAVAGLVPGARMIGPSWVAPREAWQTWFHTRRPAGRQRKTLPSGPNITEEVARMPKLQALTVDEIRAQHPGCYVESFGAGSTDDGPAQDVIVWETEDDAEGDDGARAIARYLIPA